MKERDYMCKIDLKDAYFTTPLEVGEVFMGRESLRVCVLVLDQPLEFLPKF